MWARGVRRWTREGTCEAARAHLGMETQRQGHARARARTPPALLRRYARLPLSAPRLIAPGAPCGRSPAGYGNARPPVADAMAVGWRPWWEPLPFSLSPQETDLMEIPRVWWECFPEALCYAAYLDKVKLRGYPET